MLRRPIMVKCTTKLIDPPAGLYQVLLEDQNPLRGRSYNLSLLVTKDGLAAIMASIKPALKGGPCGGVTAAEKPVKKRI
jgi:hypothetical protein